MIGTVIYNQQSGQFTAKRGPIFANLVLADEINRAPAKVQSALLEAMQELQVTIGDETFPLDRPFMVMATQNPLEQEGTYPLPEAQIDRFMLHVRVDYPSRDHERKIMERMSQQLLREGTGSDEAAQPLRAKRVITPAEIMKARKVVGQVYVDEKIKDYIIDVVLATRDPEARALERPGRHDRARRLAARVDRAEHGRARTRVPSAPRLRHARGREGRRPGRTAPPHHPHLRSGSRGDQQRAHRAPDLRSGGSAVRDETACDERELRLLLGSSGFVGGGGACRAEP